MGGHGQGQGCCPPSPTSSTGGSPPRRGCASGSLISSGLLPAALTRSPPPPRTMLMEPLPELRLDGWRGGEGVGFRRAPCVCPQTWAGSPLPPQRGSGRPGSCGHPGGRLKAASFRSTGLAAAVLLQPTPPAQRGTGGGHGPQPHCLPGLTCRGLQGPAKATPQLLSLSRGCPHCLCSPPMMTVVLAAAGGRGAGPASHLLLPPRRCNTPRSTHSSPDSHPRQANHACPWPPTQHLQQSSRSGRSHPQSPLLWGPHLRRTLPWQPDSSARSQRTCVSLSSRWSSPRTNLRWGPGSSLPFTPLPAAHLGTFAPSLPHPSCLHPPRSPTLYARAPKPASPTPDRLPLVPTVPLGVDETPGSPSGSLPRERCPPSPQASPPTLLSPHSPHPAVLLGELRNDPGVTPVPGGPGASGPGEQGRRTTPSLVTASSGRVLAKGAPWPASRSPGRLPSQSLARPCVRSALLPAPTRTCLPRHLPASQHGNPGPTPNPPAQLHVTGLLGAGLGPRAHRHGPNSRPTAGTQQAWNRWRGEGRVQLAACATRGLFQAREPSESDDPWCRGRRPGSIQSARLELFLRDRNAS